MALSSAAQPTVEVARWYGGRQAAVSYTFDDGLLEHYTLVFPELRRRGLRATFGIIGSKVGRDMKGTPCMTWAQLREMAACGQEIASHGWSHANVERLSDEALRHEVQHNDSVIADSVGAFPRTFFYPGNRKTPHAVGFCSRGRVATRLFQTSIGSKRDLPWLRRWIADLMAGGGWGVGMTHGITCGYDAFADAKMLWTHLDEVKAMSDSLWIAPLCDVAAYAAERDSVRLAVSYGRRRITVKPQMNLDPALFCHPLTLVVSGCRVVSAVQDGRNIPVAVKPDGRTLLDFSPSGGEISVIVRFY